MLKVDADLLYRFNSLGDLMLATLPGDRFVREGTVVAGTRTIPVLVKEALIQQAEALCKDKPIVQAIADAGEACSLGGDRQRSFHRQNQRRLRSDRQ